mgnify:FL=1
MIHEEICTYEVCKLAKEKGFDVPTAKKYRHKNGTTCNAPTQSLLQRWLREEKGVIIELKYSDITEDWRPFWSWSIYNNLGFTLEIGDNSSTYELALEDALKYTLENLVI